MTHSSAGPGFWTTLRRNLNFFRIHLLFFTLTPLICSGILYASNGRYPIAYIDALYNSVSAVTVCGLATTNLSQLTPWQQVLLFLQMCAGSPVVVAWFMVYIRRHFFAKKFEHLVRAGAVRRAAFQTQAAKGSELASATGRRAGKSTWRVTSLLRRRTGLSPVAEERDEMGSEEGGSLAKDKDKDREGARGKVRTDMIRRIDASPRRVNPSGWVSEGHTMPSSKAGSVGRERGQVRDPPSSPVQTEFPKGMTEVDAEAGNASQRMVTQGSDQPATAGLGLLDVSVPQTSPLQPSPASVGMPRTATIEFAPTVAHHYAPLGTVPSRHGDGAPNPSIDERLGRRVSRDTSHSRRYPGVGGQSHISLAHHPSQYTSLSRGHAHSEVNPSDFGGFPMPHKLLSMLFGRLFPGVVTRLRRTVTVQTTTALSGGELGRIASITGATGNVPEGSKPVSYISFDAIVGHNSAFHMLTNEQLEELGGVEFRGLNALLWLVALYHFGCQLVAFVVIAPYMAMPRWAKDFVPPALIRPVATPWFSLFQVISTYTNTGFSLVDQSMLPFQAAYPMIFFMVFLILAGNTAFPIFLRFMIWTIAKLIPSRSRLFETLHFLLDHPRRCFVYLFPSHQTWILLFILILFNSIDFFCFMVLDIGIPAIDSIPLGTRFAAGLLQATDVRASGFTVVPVASLAPAVKVMYVIMMYIGVYPIAMSVRSTNVYEEQSLGIFHPDDQMPTTEFKNNGSRMAMWGHYLATHARYQLSFDMWWLALALWLVCIIERDNLINPEIQGWFNIFSILFEIVSAYGSVGLSLGIPDQNYSFSGAFRPLSKLILCLVMIRGRHRGLPVAIDRAIVLPYEFERAVDDPDPPRRADERRSSRYSVSGTSHPVGSPTDDVEHEQMASEKEGKNGAGEERGS